MPIPSRVCQFCQTSFIPKRTDRIKFCGRDCSFAAHRAVPVTPPPPPACVSCNSAMPGARSNRQRCTTCLKAQARDASRQRAEASKDLTPRSCRECAATFVPEYGNKRRSFCSTQCLDINVKRTSRIRRKAKQRAVTVEPVNPIRVFDRDGWRCHMCRRATPRSLRGTHRARAPELDHIVPLSKGGEHSYANTACACRACNAAKSDTIKGQPSLLAA